MSSVCSAQAVDGRAMLRAMQAVRIVSVADARAAVLREWKEVVRKKPPADQVVFLKSSVAIAGLGSKVCRDLVHQIQRGKQEVCDQLAAAAWSQEWWEHGGPLPPGCRFEQGSGLTVDHSGLRLSRASTRYGAQGRPSRRWTPPQALSTEDFLDEMSVQEACFYDHPPSPSAAVIRRIGELRAVEV
jgi:hypothetical protein